MKGNALVPDLPQYLTLAACLLSAGLPYILESRIKSSDILPNGSEGNLRNRDPGHKP